MNEVETHRIAAAVNALRPDWPFASLLTLLNKPALTSRHRRDVAVALTWVACDSATKTPARVLEAGPWWQAVTEADGGAPRIHWLDRCSVCNYGQAACERVNREDHPFLSNGDAQARGRPTATPMPPELRDRVLYGAPDDKRGPMPRVDPRPYVPPAPVTPAERVQADVWRCDRCDEPLDGMGACWRCDDQEDDE